jgi:hypothetical protein
MGITDTFGFDSDAYYLKQISESNQKLTEKHHLKTVEFTSLSMSTGGSIAVALHTLGLSLIGGAYACRQAYIVHKQQAIIEHVLLQRGQPVPPTRISDRLVGGAIGAASGGVGMMAPVAADHFANLATGPAMGAAFNATMHPVGAAGFHAPGQAVFHNMAQGAHSAAMNQFHHGMAHYGQHVPGYQPQGYATMPTQNPQLLGYDLGYDIVPMADALVGRTITNLALDRLGGYVVHRNS